MRELTQAGTVVSGGATGSGACRRQRGGPYRVVMGHSSVKRSITMSPREVSRRTDMTPAAPRGRPAVGGPRHSDNGAALTEPENGANSHAPRQQSSILRSSRADAKGPCVEGCGRRREARKLRRRRRSTTGGRHGALCKSARKRVNSTACLQQRRRRMRWRRGPQGGGRRRTSLVALDVTKEHPDVHAEETRALVVCWDSGAGLRNNVKSSRPSRGPWPPPESTDTFETPPNAALS